MHYIDHGASSSRPSVLLLHGEPSWSFAWRTVLACLSAAGIRAIAPDHIGFGRSDKLRHREDYSYAQFVNWMTEFINQLELSNIVLVGQDWGGPIGLSALARQPEKFSAVIAANTLLPNNQPPPAGIADWPGDLVKQWVDTVAAADDLPVADIVAGVSSTALSPAVMKAYDAPFPDASYKAGALAFPELIPIDESMPGSDENRAVWQALEQWRKPFVTAFSDQDPSTAPWAEVFRHRIPGARNELHTTIDGAGHFVQEEKGHALAKVILNTIDYVEANL